MTAAAKPLAPSNPLLAAMARAKVGKPFTPEQRAELDQRMEAIRDGRTRLIPDSERDAWWAAHAHEVGESDE